MDWLPVVKARRAESAGSDVEIRGWVRTRRDSKGGFSFLEINDGSCLGNLQNLKHHTRLNRQFRQSLQIHLHQS